MLAIFSIATLQARFRKERKNKMAAEEGMNRKLKDNNDSLLKKFREMWKCFRKVIFFSRNENGNCFSKGKITL